MQFANGGAVEGHGGVMDEVNILLFPDFEALDVFGSVEVLSHGGYGLRFCSLHGGETQCLQGALVRTVPLAVADPGDILLVPGGMGTRRMVSDASFLSALKGVAESAAYCLTVCTGSALLARTGLLDGRRATSNKKAFSWVTSQNGNVSWVGAARWVQDGKFYTASGVSAGIDMALGFVGDRRGREEALRVARDIEYRWNEDPELDPFSVETS